MAIEGKWRPAAVWEEGERPESQVPRRPGGRGAGGALACGRGAGGGGTGVPTASRETGGRSGAAAPRARSLPPRRYCRPQPVPQRWEEPVRLTGAVPGGAECSSGAALRSPRDGSGDLGTAGRSLSSELPSPHPCSRGTPLGTKLGVQFCCPSRNPS